MVDDDMEGELLKAFEERHYALGPANQFMLQQDAEEAKTGDAESQKQVHEWLRSQGMGDSVPSPNDYDYAAMLRDGIYPTAGEGGLPLPPKYWKPGKMIIGGVDIATGRRIESDPLHDYLIDDAAEIDESRASADVGDLWAGITQDDLAELSSAEKRSLEAWMGSHGIQIAQGGTQGTMSDAPPAARVGRASVPYKPPSLKDITAPATALWDAMAGTLKGGVAQTAGLLGDLRSLVDMVSGGRAKEVLGDRFFPTTEEVSAALPPVIPTNSVTDLVTGGDSSRQHSAKMGQEFGETVGLGKAPVMAAKGAIAGAKALAPTAKEMARKGIERVVDSTGARLNMTAYHGTPHNWLPEPGFPDGRPRLDKMGTGEGAQSYGWGFYAAESKGVGSGYRKSTSLVDVRRRFLDELPEDADFEEVTNAASSGALGSNGKAFIEALQADEWLGFDYPSQAISAALRTDAATRYDMSDGLKKAIDGLGQTLELDVPDEVVNKMLVWDLPYSMQPEHVKKALEKVPSHLRENHSGQDILELDGTGEELYTAIADSVTLHSKDPHGSDGAKLGSEYLRKLGIPGQKYLDSGSRRKGTGTYNYVIWDQDVLDETAKRGIKKVVE